MIARAPQKFSRSEAFDACHNLTGGHCTCRRNGRRDPCDAWKQSMAMAKALGMTLDQYEALRMSDGTEALIIEWSQKQVNA